MNGERISRRQFAVAGAAGLAWVALGLRGAPPEAKIRISGTVLDQEGRKPLPGVSVSNGFTLVRTDANGRYELTADPRVYPFVFVNTPSGYAPAASHFSRLAEGPAAAEVDFQLKADPRRTGSRLRLAHVSDSHIGTKTLPNFASEDDLAEDYRAIVADCRPDLIINTGDITNDGRTIDFAVARVANQSVGLPLFTVYGNHDSDADRAEMGGVIARTNNLKFQAAMGPDQFSFDWGDYHFIVCGMYWPGESFRRPRMEAWMAADLALQPAEKRIVVLTHDKPRVSPEFSESFAPSLGQIDGHPGAMLVLHGHHHTTTALRWRKLTVVGIPTQCVGGIDTSPRGYAVIDLDGGESTVELRPLSKSGYSLSRQTERSEVDLPLPSRRRWTTQIETTLHRASPAIAEGKALFSLGDRFPVSRCGIAALDLDDGRLAWTLRTPAAVKNSAAIDPSGKWAYAAEVTGRISRFDVASGRIDWQQELPHFPDRYIYAQPLASGGELYLAQHRGTTAHEAATGRILWATGPASDDNRSSVYQKPEIDEGRLYCLVTPFIGAYGVAALNRKDGTPLWTRDLSQLPGEYPNKVFQSSYPSPVLAGDLLVAPGLADRLAVLDKREGRLVWERPVLRREGLASATRPSGYSVFKEQAHGLIVHDGIIYATTSNGSVCAVDLQSGRKLWEFFTARAPLLDFQAYFRGAGNHLTEPLVVGDHLLTGGADGYLYALRRNDGTLSAESDYRSPITVAPARAGNRVIIACFDGRVFGYDLTGLPPAPSA